MFKRERGRPCLKSRLPIYLFYRAVANPLRLWSTLSEPRDEARLSSRFLSSSHNKRKCVRGVRVGLVMWSSLDKVDWQSPPAKTGHLARIMQVIKRLIRVFSKIMPSRVSQVVVSPVGHTTFANSAQVCWHIWCRASCHTIRCSISIHGDDSSSIASRKSSI